MKKIITISMFVMLLAFTTLSTITVKAIALPPAAEDTLAACTDGIDNDLNTLTDLADGACASFAITTPVPVSENTVTFCADGIDNDFNTLIDLADPACAAVTASTTTTVVAEDTAALCSDGIDNNFNTLVDLADPACAAFSTPAPTPTPTSGGTSGSSFGSGPVGPGSSSGGITSGTPISGVFTQGTTTASCVPMTTYIKLGKKNSMQEVTRLQAFLNVYMGLKLTPSGIYNTATYNAVKAFQLKHTDNVLTPWGINYATGYFYKTTQRQMNMILCPNVNFPMPTLN